jgi:hypothetical protein
VKVTWFVRRGLVSATISAVACALLAVAPGVLPSAQAAAQAPANLHTTGTVHLGSAALLERSVFSQAPNGAVYYSIHKAIFVVNGIRAPHFVLNASGNVLAVAANKTELFVEVGSIVTGYNRSTHKVLRHWTLKSRFRITSAGLIPVGNTVWSWTDWSTDSSGFEYANLNEFSSSSSTVHRISSNSVFPADMAANSSGLFYESLNSSKVPVYLVHVTPGRVTSHVHDPNIDAPMALAGGRVELLAVHFGSNPHTYLDSYSASTLAHKFSKRVSSFAMDIDATSAGLLQLTAPCSSRLCPTTKVNVLNPTTGAASSTLRVAFAYVFVPGSHAVVLTDVGGLLSLVRLAS